MNDGILSTIGRTPLVALRRLMRGSRFNLFAKLEALNPGGSIKDRAALGMLRGAIRAGDIRSQTVVVESSSGNMGIGLAQACAYLGLRFKCVVDTRTTRQNLAILEAYGAELEMVSVPDPLGGFVQRRIDRVRELVSTLPDAFWPDQYSNAHNALAHRQTMHEIVSALAGAVDFVFCPTSTCGTIRGCADYVKEHGLPTRIVAVDAVGSVIFRADDGRNTVASPPLRRLVPGHGSSIRPGLYRHDVADVCVHVSDLDCVVGCRRVVAREGILAGGSSGAVVMAVERLEDRIPNDANCVALFPDRGERYLDTIYSDDWVAEHFGAVPASWDGRDHERPPWNVDGRFDVANHPGEALPPS